jgi:hypothetical protein
MLHTIYPEHRAVSEDTVIGWAKDTLVNAVIQHKQYATDEELNADISRVHDSAEYRLMTVSDAVTILSDNGEVTFTKDSIARVS